MWGKREREPVLAYELIRSRRRTLGLEVKGDGRVIVRAPLRLPEGEIRRFVTGHRDWIEKQQAKQAALRQTAPERLSEEEIKQLCREARRRIEERLACFAPLVGVSYGRVAIRRQKTKWGSCSSKGNLNFNCLLALAPPEVLDYVVVHELCHRLEMNHSARFWAQVRRVLPDYERPRRWLKENGNRLMEMLHGQ
ncbi:MAG: M48 family metallopeptidase [Oscillospiraceae bacterium]|nr:M48 family metallopeptidase [Oscillospiraceae bacterium]